MNDHSPVGVRVWSDFTCPFCYVGKRRLERASREMGVPIAVTWRSFELDPHSPAIESASLVDVLARKYGVSASQAEMAQRRIAAVAAKEGLDFQWQVARPGNTFDAHRILHLATSVGLGEAAEEAFLRAYFTEGRAIGDPAVVRSIGREIGLQVTAVDRVLAGDAYADAVRADEREAAARLGVTGVPYFLIDGTAIEGARPLHVFRHILESTHADLGRSYGPAGTCAAEGVCELSA